MYNALRGLVMMDKAHQTTHNQKTLVRTTLLYNEKYFQKRTILSVFQEKEKGGQIEILCSIDKLVDF